MGGGEDQRGRCGFGGKAVHRLQFDHLVTHGADDAKTAGHGAAAHGAGAEQHHPDRHLEALQGAVAEEGQRNDAHGLLGVVAAVAECQGFGQT